MVRLGKTGNIERVFVHPDFKKMLKVEAAQNGKTIIDYTEELAKSRKSLLEETRIEPQSRKPFSFRL